MSRFDFKRRIIVLIMLVYSITIYELFQSPILRLEGLLGIFAFSEISVIAYFPRYFRTFQELFKHPKPGVMLIPNEIYDLMEKTDTKRIRVKAIPGVFGALSNLTTIYLGEELLKDFSIGMILAVFAHELGHIKGRHIIIEFTAMYFLLAVLLFTVVGPPIILLLAIFSVMTLSLVPIHWHFEYSADRYAVELVGEEELKTALKALGDRHGYRTYSETHPSIAKRLEKIIRRK